MKTRLAVVAVAATSTATALWAAPLDLAKAGAERTRAQAALIRYDTALVPEGAQARVQAVANGSGATIITLHTWGLLPDRTYGAHVHTSPCGSTGGAAGPHYQHVQGGLTDPAFANPHNEVWLDIRTDDEGNAAAQSRVEWTFRSGGAGSVIVHANSTNPANGTAGPRVACITVPL